MTYTNRKAAERFVADENGAASNMRSEMVSGVRCMVGYGWAVYALYMADEDRFVLFGTGYRSDGSEKGWVGYSSTTTKQIHTIKDALERAGAEYDVVDRQLTTKELRGSFELSEILSETA